jgi:FtsH-binding integral membrane protein
MLYKKTIVTEIIFLLFIGVSSIYYFNIGQWKSYVRLFSVVEILVLLASLVIFSARILKKGPLGYTPLLFTYSILCAMQLFPMIGAILIIHSYLYPLVHLIIMMFGIMSIILLVRPQKKLIKT